MALTKSFKNRVQTRAETDPDFRYGLLTESIESMLSGDIETGKSLLRDYVNATIGFDFGRISPCLLGSNAGGFVGHRSKHQYPLSL